MRSIVPLGRGYFSQWLQALRARLLSCCPSGTKALIGLRLGAESYSPLRGNRTTSIRLNFAQFRLGTPRIGVDFAFTAWIDRQALAMNRYLAMPVAQNAAIVMWLLCPSDSVSNDAMDMSDVVDRKGFVSRSKEENAATATLERAATPEYLSSFEP